VNERRCFTCAHGQDRGGDLLYCRRYPPAVKPTVQGTTLMMMGWPEVYSNNVCGEWADRTTKPATPQPDAAPASILVSAMEEGAKAERAAIVQWLFDAQYHVVMENEVSVLNKVRRQIEGGLHIPSKKVKP